MYADNEFANSLDCSEWFVHGKIADSDVHNTAKGYIESYRLAYIEDPKQLPLLWQNLSTSLLDLQSLITWMTLKMKEVHSIVHVNNLPHSQNSVPNKPQQTNENMERQAWVNHVEYIYIYMYNIYIYIFTGTY